MGSVKVDVHKSDRPYEFVSFSDIECIKGLITKRAYIDGCVDVEHVTASNWKKSFGENSIGYASDYIGDVNQEIIAIYATLDEYIKRIKLTDKQKFLLEKIMIGYSYRDIYDVYGYDIKNTNRDINIICRKIKYLNDILWKYNYIDSRRGRIGYKYIECLSCSEYLPETTDFFYKDKDGYKKICKNCNSSKKSDVF